MKRYIICLILSFFSFTNIALASKVNKVDIDVSLDENGDAIIVEKWNIQKQTATTFQRDFYDANVLKISDYSIVDDKNSSYREVSNDEFNPKDGFVYTFVDEGYKKALKFATIGDKNDFTITYKVEGMIKKFKDVFGIDFYFIGPNDIQTYGAISIHIKAPIEFNANNTGLYTLGNSRALAEFNDGTINIYCSNQEEQESIRLMTIFTGIEFKNVVIENENFQDVYNKAVVGRNKLEEILSTVKVSTVVFISIVIIVAVGSIIVYKVFFNKDDYEEYHNIETAGNATILSYDDAAYFDSVPLNGDLYKIGFIAGYFKLTKSRSDLIGAILFKWLCEGNIDLGKKHGKYYIHIKEMRQFTRNLDSEFYNIWMDASNTSTIDGSKLIRYASSHYLKMMTWFNMGFSESISDEMARNHITKTKRMNKDITVLGDAIINYGNEIQGLKKYLLNFNQVPRKTELNEDLYQNLLVCAVLLGIGDQVGREILRKSPDNELAKKLVEFEEYKTIYKGSYEAALTPYKEQIRRLRRQNKRNNKNKEFDPTVENILDNQLHKQDTIESVDDLPKSKL